MPDTFIYSFFLIIAILLIVIFFLIFKLRRILKLSLIDEMTSISNYRGFEKTINTKINNQYEFTLVIIDIDDFRKFNFKSYAYGDCVLKEFVNFLKINLPEDSFIARYKFGDEFLIIINDDIANSTEKIKNIKEKCKNNIFQNISDKSTFNIDFSFGAAHFETNNDNLHNLLFKTEKALKENKISN